MNSEEENDDEEGEEIDDDEENNEQEFEGELKSVNRVSGKSKPNIKK